MIQTQTPLIYKTINENLTNAQGETAIGHTVALLGFAMDEQPQAEALVELLRDTFKERLMGFGTMAGKTAYGLVFKFGPFETTEAADAFSVDPLSLLRSEIAALDENDPGELRVTPLDEAQNVVVDMTVEVHAVSDGDDHGFHLHLYPVPHDVVGLAMTQAEEDFGDHPHFKTTALEKIESADEVEPHFIVRLLFGGYESAETAQAAAEAIVLSFTEQHPTPTAH